MSLRTMFHTAEMGLYGFVLPFTAMLGGTQIASVAAKKISEPIIAETVVENIGPALTALSVLYIAQLALKKEEREFPVLAQYKLAALSMAALMGFGVVGDHLQNGPFLNYEITETGQRYISVRPPSP